MDLDQKGKLSASGQEAKWGSTRLGLTCVCVCSGGAVLLPGKLRVGGRAVRSSEVHD